MSDEAIIEVRGLTKAFGRRIAVNNVNLTVPCGTCFGFLGPNGAGKTTMMRMLLGLARPTSGVALVRGIDVRSARQAALARVGAIVEEPRFYPYLSGRANLEIWAAYWGGPAPARIPGLLDRVGLGGRGADKVKNYSQGMRQRLGVAAALMHQPRLVVLDEPTSGLDPAGTREMRALLPRIASEGTTVVLASHLLTEVEQVCTRVAIMQAGAVIASGTVESLTGQRPRWRVRVTPAERARAIEVLRGVTGTGAVESGEDDLLIDTVAGGAALNRALVDAGVVASEIEHVVPTLESIFIELTERKPSS